MEKRSFRRQGELLYDEETRESMMRSSIRDRVVGEAKRIEALRKPTGGEVVLPDAESSQRPESLPRKSDRNQLLDAVRKGRPLVLEDYLTVRASLADPDFIQAAIEGLWAAAPARLSTYAEWMGIAATESCRDALVSVVLALANPAAGGSAALGEQELCDLSIALEVALRLAPLSAEAASALERLTRDPRPRVRLAAVRSAASLYRAKSPLLAPFGAAAERIASSDEDPLVCLHVVALGFGSREAIEPILSRLLRHPDEAIRGSTAAAALALGAPWSIALVLGWLPDEPSLAVSLHIARSMAGLLAEPFLRDLALRGLASTSPMTRFFALNVVACLPHAVGAELAASALETEPDPELQCLLGVMSQGP